MNPTPTVITGNVTNDPELTFTGSGQARLSFSIASNYVWYDQAGEKQEKVSFFNIVAWRYTAENAAKTLEKGIGVVVVGRLEQRSYEDKEGNKRSAVELIADAIAIDTRSIEEVTRRAKQQDGEQGNGKPRPASSQGARRATPTTTNRRLEPVGAEEEVF